MDIFQAIADPTRRALLQQLLQGDGLSVTELCSPAQMSRQAVTKHLAILVGAGLVSEQWQGRQKLHYLQPEPLITMQHWLQPYAERWDQRLASLQKHLGESS